MNCTNALAVDATALPKRPRNDGRAMYDPLLDLIATYRAEMARFNAEARFQDGEDAVAAFAAATFEPLFAQLCDNPPAPTTRAGALAAIRCIREELRGGTVPEEMVEHLLGGALAVLEREEAA